MATRTGRADGSAGDRSAGAGAARSRGAGQARAAARARAGGQASSRAVYVISVAAELAGMHPQTLRIYERKGLVDPTRTSGGSRRFSDRDLERLQHIQELTNAGINLEGVRRVLELEAEVASLRAELERVQDEARDAVDRVHRHYRRDLVPVSRAPVPFHLTSKRKTRR